MPEKSYSKALTCKIQKDGFINCQDNFYNELHIIRPKRKPTTPQPMKEPNWDLVSALLVSETKRKILLILDKKQIPVTSSIIVKHLAEDVSQPHISGIMASLKEDGLIKQITNRQYGSLYRISPIGTNVLRWTEKIEE